MPSQANRFEFRIEKLKEGLQDTLLDGALEDVFFECQQLAFHKLSHLLFERRATGIDSVFGRAVKEVVGPDTAISQRKMGKKRKQLLAIRCKTFQIGQRR